MVPAKETVKARADDQLDRELESYSATAKTALTTAGGERREQAPDHRLAIYTGVAGAALAGALTADAAVVTFTKGVTLSAGNTTSSWSMAGNTIRARWQPGTGPDFYEYAWLMDIGGSASWASDGGGMGNVERIGSGQTISSGWADGWASNPGTTPPRVTTLFNEPAGGNFLNGNAGYAGVRVDAGGGQHYYGWIHISSVKADNTEFYVGDYSWDNAADTAITTPGGAPPGVPEPSTIALALLASGAAGLMSARRKKLLRDKKEG